MVKGMVADQMALRTQMRQGFPARGGLRQAPDHKEISKGPKSIQHIANFPCDAAIGPIIKGQEDRRARFALRSDQVASLQVNLMEIWVHSDGGLGPTACRG